MVANGFIKILCITNPVYAGFLTLQVADWKFLILQLEKSSICNWQFAICNGLILNYAYACSPGQHRLDSDYPWRRIRSDCSAATRHQKIPSGSLLLPKHMASVGVGRRSHEK